MSLMGWAILFLVLAVIAAVLGFGVLATAAGAVLKILFYIFLAIFVITLISHLTRRRV